MGLHARQVAVAAGASEAQINRLADQMAAEGVVRVDRAEEILKEWSQNPNGNS
jgi:hydroxymethylglutaryl-CoA reductase